MQKEIIGITGASGVLGRYFIKKYQIINMIFLRMILKILKKLIIG